MQSQLALVLNETPDEGLGSEVGGNGGYPGAGSGSGNSAHNLGQDRYQAVIEPIHSAMKRRPGDFGVLSNRARRIGLRGVAKARARLAALPAPPDIDLDYERGAA